MSSTILDHAVAVDLPDVLPARKQRGKVAMFAYRHPSIFAGGLLVSLVVASAVFAPWLGSFGRSLQARWQKPEAGH